MGMDLLLFMIIGLFVMSYVALNNLYLAGLLKFFCERLYLQLEPLNSERFSWMNSIKLLIRRSYYAQFIWHKCYL
ncbi:hypothetical protein CDL12_10679 [Handroanthus impetiginosus]|uniref:Uncharacterized protein n=1 Tax=Handroanthus impetiginosus TaxID=429701 RepID=A0A2G9HGK0_9LAMI|nr:hypothetical protein CDL12_10679 [Handroanthus impetiginosus]